MHYPMSKNRLNSVPRYWGDMIREKTGRLRDSLIAKLQALNIGNCHPELYDSHMDALNDIVRLAESVRDNIRNADEHWMHIARQENGVKGGQA